MVYFPVNSSNGPLPSSVRSMSIIHKNINVNKYLHGLTRNAKLSGSALKPIRLGTRAVPVIAFSHKMADFDNRVFRFRTILLFIKIFV